MSGSFALSDGSRTDLLVASWLREALQANRNAPIQRGMAHQRACQEFQLVFSSRGKEVHRTFSFVDYAKIKMPAPSSPYFRLSDILEFYGFSVGDEL